ncbi:MAG: GSCFA domain-containing protein [Bacteroidetes bacterium]|nr:GSCFA domain-containing protein [Bacteroidota bacterium]
MNFKLNFDIKSPARKINYSDKLFFIGSCFSENIAEQFDKHLFSVVSNSHGILFNPTSIANAFQDVINKTEYTEKDIFFEQGLWRSFQHHGQFSNADKAVCLEQINASIKNAHEKLKKSEYLFITLGSAFAYKHIQQNSVVANCHKIPATEFEKVLISKEDITSAYEKLITDLKKLNPKIKIAFTVSPVRYIRDGLVENNHSKAILLQSIHDLIATNENCFYFPSYEIVIDELRDYRFFKEDMVHPNELAVKYIWERMQQSWIDATTIEFIIEAGQYNRLLEHRVLNESERGKHEENIAAAKNSLLKKYPNLQI